MSTTQNLTKPLEKTPEAPDPMLNQKLMFIDFKAVGGWITDADKTIPEKMTMETFANKLGVARETLYNWQKSIPDFWLKVAERRKELGSHERLVKVHDSWYLKALSGSFPHMQLWLANFDPDFRMPTEKVEHELGDGWAQLARSRIKAMDGEVVSESENAAN